MNVLKIIRIFMDVVWLLSAWYILKTSIEFSLMLKLMNWWIISSFHCLWRYIFILLNFLLFKRFDAENLNQIETLSIDLRIIFFGICFEKGIIQSFIYFCKTSETDQNLQHIENNWNNHSRGSLLLSMLLWNSCLKFPSVISSIQFLAWGNEQFAVHTMGHGFMNILVFQTKALPTAEKQILFVNLWCSMK